MDRLHLWSSSVISRQIPNFDSAISRCRHHFCGIELNASDRVFVKVAFRCRILWFRSLRRSKSVQAHFVLQVPHFNCVIVRTCHDSCIIELHTIDGSTVMFPGIVWTWVGYESHTFTCIYIPFLFHKLTDRQRDRETDTDTDTDTDRVRCKKKQSDKTVRSKRHTRAVLSSPPLMRSWWA